MDFATERRCMIRFFIELLEKRLAEKGETLSLSEICRRAAEATDYYMENTIETLDGRVYSSICYLYACDLFFEGRFLALEQFPKEL